MSLEFANMVELGIILVIIGIFILVPLIVFNRVLNNIREFKERCEYLNSMRLELSDCMRKEDVKNAVKKINIAIDDGIIERDDIKYPNLESDNIELIEIKCKFNFKLSPSIFPYFNKINNDINIYNYHNYIYEYNITNIFKISLIIGLFSSLLFFGEIDGKHVILHIRDFNIRSIFYALYLLFEVSAIAVIFVYPVLIMAVSCIDYYLPEAACYRRSVIAHLNFEVLKIMKPISHLIDAKN